MKEDELAWKLFSAGIEVASANGQAHTTKAKVRVDTKINVLVYYVNGLTTELICCIKTIADEILSQRPFAASRRYCLLDNVIL